MSIQTTSETTLSAIRVIRMAWFDEKLDAEARGDITAAKLANMQLDACDRQIRRLEEYDELSAARSWLGLLGRIGSPRR
jgi:hypothetical protein